MAVTWDLIKYVPDVWRNEPKNIGVVLHFDTGVLLRFFAEDGPGRIDGRRLGRSYGPMERYKEWVAYFRRKATTGEWTDVLGALASRPDFPFVVQAGGQLWDFDERHAQDELNSLFKSLVEEAEQNLVYQAPKERDGLRDRVLRVMREANLSVQNDLTVPARFAPGPRGCTPQVGTVKFQFGYKRGRQFLMDSIRRPDAALNFFARAEAAYKADSGLRFMAFYRSTSDVGRDESHLRIVEQYADAVDIENEAEAASQVQHLISQ